MNASMSDPSPILPPFDLSVRSGEMAVREALGGLIGWRARLSLDVEEISTVELVVAEALNNIVEHAYPEENDEGPIDLACTHRFDGLHLTIRDRGRAMPGGQAPIGMVQDTDVDTMDLPEGGFGWFLIQNLAKDVKYGRVQDENQLELRLAVAVRKAN